MESLPYELLFKILLPLTYEDIIKTCLTNQYYQNIYHDTNFWKTKVTQDFQIKTELLTNKIEGPNLYLYYLYHEKWICLPGSEKVIDINDCLEVAIDNGDLSLVKYFVNKSNINLNEALQQAVINNNLEIVNYLVSQGATLKLKSSTETYPLIVNIIKEIFFAASTNNRQKIDYLLNISSAFYYLTVTKQLVYPYRNQLLEEALEGAITGGKLDLIKYLISLGAKHLDMAIYKAVINTNN